MELRLSSALAHVHFPLHLTPFNWNSNPAFNVSRPSVVEVGETGAFEALVRDTP
jgi:hypothetical protein